MNKWIEVYEEMKGELDSVEPTRPSVEEILSEICPLPSEAVVLGVCGDGLPMVLNVKDPAPGSVLVVSDHGCGKTNFLRSVASLIPHTHTSEEIQYAVITNNPGEWDENENCVGIFSSHHKSSEDLLLSLAGWAHGSRSRQSVILLFDDITELSNMDFDAINNFRWLMLRGAARGVWIFASINSSDIKEVELASQFRTRIFGRTTDEYCLRWGGLDGSVKNLRNQYILKEGDGWIKFFTPEL